MKLVVQNNSALFRIHTVGKICGPGECLWLQQLTNVWYAESNRRCQQTKKIQNRWPNFTTAHVFPTLTDCFINIHINIIVVSFGWSST